MRAVFTAARFTATSASACLNAACASSYSCLLTALIASQFTETLRLQPRRGDVGFGLHERGLRAVQGGPHTWRIDLIQGLPRLHVGALGKQTLLKDAADLRPDFRHLKRRDAPGKGVV